MLVAVQTIFQLQQHQEVKHLPKVKFLQKNCYKSMYCYFSQHELLCIRRKMLREVSVRWPGNTLPQFGIGNKKEREESDQFVLAMGRKQLLKDLPNIREQVMTILKERRKNLRLGIDYSDLNVSS